MMITMISFASTYISGVVTQTDGKQVSIEVISENGDSTIYQCEEDNAFKIKLDKDSHYTLIFTCENGESKYVYFDTHDIGSQSGYSYEVLMYEYDTVVCYEPYYHTPLHSVIERSSLEWICQHFPLVRDYNPQLIEMGAKPYDCD